MSSPSPAVPCSSAETRGLAGRCGELLSDTQAEVARASGHFTPRLVAAEVARGPARVPVYLYHMKPPSLSRIRREIAALREPRLKLLDSERSFRF